MNRFDVAIIGGGVIGTSIAFELASRKLRVAVFDRQDPGREASWAAAGMLSPAPDSPRDLPLVPLGNESRRIYSDFVAAVEEASGKTTGYARDGAIELFSGAQGEAERDRRVAECLKLRVEAQAIPLSEARRMESSIGPSVRAAAWLREEGTVEPRSLMDALLAALRQKTVEVRSHCGVTELLCEGDRCSGVVTGGEKISADFVVLAAGCFSGQVGGEPGYALTRPARGQMLALRLDGRGLQCVLRSERGYLVPRRDGQIIAGSTSEEAGFEKRVTPAGMRKILDAAIEMCPALANAELLETWSGLRPGTPDDLPIIGRADLEGLVIATGHYRNGILLAPITARLVRELIAGQPASFDLQPFSPARFRQNEAKSVLQGT